ncbi:Pyridoxal Kinase [Manis pentadactyla]|nr:Pyridoxal Kinase [Manis pentadactyla]
MIKIDFHAWRPLWAPFPTLDSWEMPGVFSCSFYRYTGYQPVESAVLANDRLDTVQFSFSISGENKYRSSLFGKEEPASAWPGGTGFLSRLHLYPNVLRDCLLCGFGILQGVENIHMDCHPTFPSSCSEVVYIKQKKMTSPFN